MKILLVAINAKYIHSNKAVYSLYSYASDLISSDNQIEVAQYNINQQPLDILSDIYKRKPDVVAFSCYIWNMNIVKILLEDIASVLPAADIWLGGPEVSFDSEKLIKKYSALTGVMIGEGEQTFRELVLFYRDFKSSVKEYKCKEATDESKEIRERNNFYDRIKNIKGLCIRNENGLNAIFTDEREIADINSIPFIYDKVGLERFENQIIYYESSRGCPFRCSYCLSAIDKTVRLRDIDLVKKEIKFFLDNNVKQVKFIDRTFNCNREHAISIWKYILENDNGITNFHFEVAADILTDDEIDVIGKMRPGLIQLEIGVQSTNPETIREINRVMDLDKVKENVRKVKAFGNTHQHLDLIVGLPYEDKKSFIKSFNDVHNMNPDQLQLGFLKVLKGSDMESKREQYGLKYHNTPNYEVFSTKWISYSEVLELKKIEEMVELFYNSSQFETTLKLLFAFFNTPYELYEALANHYEKKGYYINTPARSYKYNVLFEFAKGYIENEALISEALTFDLYLREKCKSRADFSKDLSVYKEQIRKINDIYNKDKKKHVDVFNYPVWEKSFELMSNKMQKEKYVIFDYDNRDRLSFNALYELV